MNASKGRAMDMKFLDKPVRPPKRERSQPRSEESLQVLARSEGSLKAAAHPVGFVNFRSRVCAPALIS